MNAQAAPLTPAAVPAASAAAPLDALDSCHREVVAALQSLARLVELIDRNGLDDGTRKVAHDAHLFFATTALNHHLDEERHVFPALLASDDAELVQVTRRLQMDHGWLEEDWLELAPQIEAISRGYSWFDLDVLRHGIEVFTALYHDHIRLEESLIYPEARSRLSSADLQTMSREMAERRSVGRNKAPAQARPI